MRIMLDVWWAVLGGAGIMTANFLGGLELWFLGGHLVLWGWHVVICNRIQGASWLSWQHSL